MKINTLDTKEDLRKVFIQLNEQLFRYVYIRCGYNREQAEDITQDIFIKIWEKRELFNPKKSSLKNWIYVIARNYIVDYYRLKKPTKIIDPESWESIASEVTGTQENEFMLEQVMKGLKKISAEDQEIITLRYIQELEIKDICKIIKKGYIATKVSIHRALKRLKNVINI
ncbi:RNA polymerase sigma factor [Candidatus Dojkabacteria bacterium]|nr:RNA polymerase sigma factor [Candidatus Dojkabacteria bacterium]